MKETVRRALRTFIQAAVGYIAANVVMVVSGAGEDAASVKNALIMLITAAVACGISAAMNLPKKTPETGDEATENGDDSENN